MRTTQLRTKLSKVADLYKSRPITPALHKAHQKLDCAVDAAYQPSGGKNLRHRRRTRDL